MKPGAPPNEVRIGGGLWRGRKLPVPAAPNAAALRPTPDRVRQTLFNWLGQRLTGWRVCDAFAGTGALGLEAASRGAGSVVLVERDRALAAALRSSVARLAATGVRVVEGDAPAFLAAQPPGAFDLVLLDPPFGDTALAANALAAAARCVGERGFVYLEAPAEADPAPAGWARHRHTRAGRVHAHLFVRAPGAASAEPPWRGALDFVAPTPARKPP